MSRDWIILKLLLLQAVKTDEIKSIINHKGKFQISQKFYWYYIKYLG